MPDRRFSNGRKLKKPCRRCTHGIAIHHPKRTSKGVTNPCWYPGCKCTDYRPEKQR